MQGQAVRLCGLWCVCVSVCVRADLYVLVCDLSDLFIWKVCMFNSMGMCVCARISGPKTTSLKLKSGFFKCL